MNRMEMDKVLIPQRKLNLLYIKWITIKEAGNWALLEGIDQFLRINL